jgi:hypothetical protein
MKNSGQWWLVTKSDGQWWAVTGQWLTLPFFNKIKFTDVNYAWFLFSGDVIVLSVLSCSWCSHVLELCDMIEAIGEGRLGMNCPQKSDGTCSDKKGRGWGQKMTGQWPTVMGQYQKSDGSVTESDVMMTESDRQWRLFYLAPNNANRSLQSRQLSWWDGQTVLRSPPSIHF